MNDELRNRGGPTSTGKTGAPAADAGAGAVKSGEQGTSLRYRMMDLARTRGDVISLGRGDPDLHTPPAVIEGALAAFASSDSGGSAPSQLPDSGVEGQDSIRGLLALRQGIARRYGEEKGIELDPRTEILVTNGAQEGLFLAMLALVDPGDRVACPDPRYTSYDQAIGAAGGVIDAIPTGGDHPFELGADDLRQYASGSKLLIFVNPSNPTGACVGAEGVGALAAAAEELDLVVLADEIYEDVVFDGLPFRSFLSMDGARERTVTLSGFSKSYAMTGFRVGYLVGPPDFIDAVAALKATTSGPCPVFSQGTALAALEVTHDTRADFLAVYASRREALLNGFDALDMPYGPHGGGLFMWADVSRSGMDAETFCYRLLEETGVLMFPGNSFGPRWKNWVRVSLLAREEEIVEAMRRVAAFVERAEDA